MANGMFDLSGRVAVVTGGNGGIGRGMALGMAEAGAKIAILARNENKSAAVLEELKKIDAEAIALKLDVTRRADLRPAMDEVERRLGSVDILVNNAGIAIVDGVLKLSPESWDRVLETNLNSVFILTQIAAQSMVKRGRGKIINIASEYSRFGSSGVPSYSASKGGIIQLTKSSAIELAPHNIQVNAIVPGWIWSEMTAPVKDTPLYKEIILRTPAGRFGEPGKRWRAPRSSSPPAPQTSSPARPYSWTEDTRSARWSIKVHSVQLSNKLRARARRQAGHGGRSAIGPNRRTRD